VIGNTTELQFGFNVQTETVSGTIQRINYILADLFYNAAVFPDGDYPDATYEHTYGEMQLFDVWNQFRTEMRILDCSLQGCDLGELDSDNLTDIAHLVNKWNPTDASFHLVYKLFILLHFTQDHDRQAWRGVFRQVVDLKVSKDYSNHEFGYIEND